MDGALDLPPGMPWFEDAPAPREGLCSWPACPCDEARIPSGAGFLYVTPECVDLRGDARTPAELDAKLRRMGEAAGSLLMLGPGVAGPVLLCERGLDLLELDREVAAADARRWWASGRVPLRPTPRRDRPHWPCGHERDAGPSACPRCAAAGTCWFCGREDAAAGAAHEVALERQVPVSPTQVRVERRVVEVPRCARCQEVHARLRRFDVVSAVLGFTFMGAAGVAAYLLSGGEGAAALCTAIAALVPAALAAGAGSRRILSRAATRGPYDALRGQPDVEELKRRGFAPPG